MSLQINVILLPNPFWLTLPIGRTRAFIEAKIAFFLQDLSHFWTQDFPQNPDLRHMGIYTGWILLFTGIVVGILWIYILGSGALALRRASSKPKIHQGKLQSFVETNLKSENSRLRAEVEALRAQVNELDQDLKNITLSWRSKLFSEPIHKMNIGEASAQILSDLQEENPDSTSRYQ